MTMKKLNGSKWWVGVAVTLGVLVCTAIWNTSQLSARVDANTLQATEMKKLVERLDSRMRLIEQSNARIEVNLKFQTQLLQQLQNKE